MAGKLVLTLLGSAALSCPDGSTLDLGRKALALLGYLAQHPTGKAHRDHLAGMLWGERDNAKARGSLRQTLFDLRSCHPAVARALEVDRQSVRLVPGVLETDVERMQADLVAGRVPEDLMTASHVLEQLFYGSEDIGEGFADWVIEQRATLSRQWLTLMEQGFADQALPPSARQRLAVAALRLEPLNELACRALMSIAAEAGDIGQALRVYGDFYRRLGDEMDMEPSMQTQDLAVRIKQGAFDALPVAAAPSRPAGRFHGQPLLAVLPMRALGPGLVPDLPEMLVEDIVCKLASLRDLPVISTASTRRLSDDPEGLGLLRDQFGVDYVLASSLRAQGNQFRVTAQLTELATGVVIWARSFDARSENLLGLQTDIAAAIVSLLLPSVHLAQLRQVHGFRPENLSAYHLMLQAKEAIYTLDRDRFAEAGALLQTAAVQDATFAQVHVALADWYSLNIGQGWSRDPLADRLRLEACVQTAIRHHPNDGRALAILGHNLAIYSRRYDEAFRLFDRAIEATPNDAETLLWSGPSLAYTGAHDEAIGRLDKAIALSPEDPLLFRYEHFLSIAHFAAGDHAEAARLGERSMRRNERYTSNLRVTAASMVALGRLQDARDLANRVLDLEPEFRISDFVAKQGFTDVLRRQDFGEKLRLAGLPV